MLRSVTTLAAVALGLTAISLDAGAAPLSVPANDPNFMYLSNGTALNQIKVSGSRLTLTKGVGQRFTSSHQAAYQQLKHDSQTRIDHPVQWVFMDLDNHQVIAQSANANIKQFGASVSKIFVAGTLLDKTAGKISSSQLQLMANMLVVSSNTAWTELQKQIGDGNADRGRAANYAFTQRMGYQKTRGFQGWWGNFHGNELTAAELAEFLYDTYQANYPGSEVIWKLMHTCRTGTSRGLRYLPTDIYVGGKTGTYDGTTVEPESGRSTNPDGSAYKVRVRHHTLTFHVRGRTYALAILANTGTDDSTALLTAGLFYEYTGYTSN